MILAFLDRTRIGTYYIYKQDVLLMIYFGAVSQG